MKTVEPVRYYVTAAVTRGHTYVWFFDRDHRSDVVRTASRFACDDDHVFTWWDVAKVARSLATQFGREEE